MLLSLVEQIIHDGPSNLTHGVEASALANDEGEKVDDNEGLSDTAIVTNKKVLVKKLRLQVNNLSDFCCYIISTDKMLARE